MVAFSNAFGSGGSGSISADDLPEDEGIVSFTNENANIYVDNVGGDDNNEGFDVNFPLQTLAAAFSLAGRVLVFGSGSLIINLVVNPGVPYPTRIRPPRLLQGLAGFITPLVPTERWALQPSTNGGFGVIIVNQRTSNWTIQRCDITRLSGIGPATAVLALNGGIVRMESCNIGSDDQTTGGFATALNSSGSGTHINLFRDTQVLGRNYSWGLSCSNQGLMTAAGNVNLNFGTNTSFASGFLLCQNLANTIMPGINFTGTFTGRRFSVSNNAIIDAPGASNLNAFPGTIAGAVSSGGIYV